MSRLTDLIAQAKAKDPQMGADLEREFKALSSRRSFGLNFERHRPETVELPNHQVRKGDKVRVLPPRGETKKGDQRLWQVKNILKESNQWLASLVELNTTEPETQKVSVEDLVVVAEFRDKIYPGLISTGKVERGGSKPFHSVINGENFHALKALTYTHRGKIDVIYIDPPYNTGAKDWKYNNDYVESEDLYRHSKWLAFIERRLKIAKKLLDPNNSVLIITIDEKEYLRLGLLLEQTYPNARIQMVSSAINPAAQARTGSFARIDEYIFVVMLGNAAPERLPLSREWVSAKGRTHTGKIRWDLLKRSGTAAQRSDSPGGFYPIYFDSKSLKILKVGKPLAKDESAPQNDDQGLYILPIRKDGSEGRWQVSPQTLETYISQGRVRVSGNKERGFTVYYLKPGEWKKIESGEYTTKGIGIDGAIIVNSLDKSNDVVEAIPSTQWKIASHDATQYGSRLLSELLPGRKFPFPKSLYAVEDILRFFLKNNDSAIVLDFFSGSGTTCHALMRLNKQDNGKRQCISITNNEVAAEEQKSLRIEKLRPGDLDWEKHGICESITKPRIEAAITGKTPDGVAIKGKYKFVDEFDISEGFLENAEFFTLTYESPLAVTHNLAFESIASLLWLRAGSIGKRIDTVPNKGWEVVEAYGILVDLDKSNSFILQISETLTCKLAYIVTNDDRRFQAVARSLPERVEPVRLYESYLNNFQFANGE